MEKQDATRSLRERVGINVLPTDQVSLVAHLVELEEAGVEHAWLSFGPLGAPDLLTTLAAAVARTSQLKLGTYVVQVSSRHPVLMAQQALSLNSLAPGRLRLGIGTGSPAHATHLYGVTMDAPLTYLREYIQVLRPLLERGEVHHQGRYFSVDATLPGATHVPLYISALGVGAFRLAGEVTDGALPYMAPISYLLNTALPALNAGAQKAGRSRPPVVAHVPVAFTEDRATALRVGRQTFRFMTTLPHYRNMFFAAGFTEQEVDAVSDRFVESLLVFGDEGKIRDRLQELLTTTEIDALALGLVPISDATQEGLHLARFVGRL
ncbi:LLM class flavin-dependent oxidoreductase [Ktedonosporobacter rubrisoli]|uniref:LLM class flavin-dependent oxidoreductase n=1 Tax=Ktedonosporobacter rubrisoli TaxID=2509675 RepID=A0A4P6JYY9_KTERU|nr:LLM class flavin-dependent oxidoreductase [Ktedonosporobacter rubrisoli]QBD80722.1 LLM class flavin-dependent oxidoreductase [Ktedonosporobacter rubrisoli]